MMTPMVRVLLVDDEAALLRAYVRGLARDSYDVVTASTGTEAVAAIEKGRFDVIVSDIAMPNMTGIELLRVVRERDPDVPVILITGNPSVDTAVQAVEFGAMRYLPKPVEIDALRELISRAAKLHQLARLKREALEHLGASDGLNGDRASLEASFVRALRSIFMAVQPIVCWSEKRIFGYEALVRTQEPMLPNPGALIAAAEKLGRLHHLGRTIRVRAATASADLPEPYKLFVNLHPYDLQDDTLYSPQSELSQMAPRVVLEITERASLEDVDDLRTRIAKLRALGYQLAVDDLGAGYAGLSSFATLEPEIVKVDMSLVRGVHAEPTKQKLIGSLSASARSSTSRSSPRASRRSSSATCSSRSAAICCRATCSLAPSARGPSSPGKSRSVFVVRKTCALFIRCSTPSFRRAVS